MKNTNDKKRIVGAEAGEEKRRESKNASENTGFGMTEGGPDPSMIPDMTPMRLEPYKTVLIVERHGESVGNAERTYHGHSDISLSERGFEQVARSAEFLRDLKIDAIYSSDLQRALQTAEAHLAYHPELEIIPQERLRELNVGQWQGMRVVDIIEQYGEYFTVEWKEEFGTFRGAPGGESVPAGAVRLSEALLDIARKNEGKTVLVASHAAVIRAAFSKICGIPAEEVGRKLPFPTNASLTVIYFDGERLVPGEFSHDSHLADT